MDEVRDAMQNILNALWYCERIQPDLTPKLRDGLRLLIRKEYDVAIHQKVMEELNTIDPMQVDPLQFDDLFQTLFKEKQELFQPYTEDGHPLMIEFNRIIYSIHHPGESIPGELFFTQSLDDDRKTVFEQPTNLICPITQQPLENPLLNPQCNHCYSEEAIKEYLKLKDDCPVAGCNVKISFKNLKRAANIERKVKEMKRQKDEEMGSEELSKFIGGLMKERKVDVEL